jgi:diguanylate cyclase (GGDEF)-like protein
MVAVSMEHTRRAPGPLALPATGGYSRPYRHERILWGAALGAAVVVPAASFLLASAWPTLALPPLGTAAAWCVAAHRRRNAAVLAAADYRARTAAVHDELTGCANEAGLRLLGDRLLSDVRRRGDALHALAVEVGLSRLGHVPDDHAIEDVLVAVGESLRSSSRGSDVVARCGPDEFVVLGAGCGMPPAELERRVRALLMQAPPVPAAVWPCRVTVGKSVLQPWDGGELDDLLGRAEQDLQIRAAMRAPSVPEPPLTATS